MPHVVRGEVLGRFQVHKQQIPDGVVVFGPVEPPHRHAPRVGFRVAIRVFKQVADRLEKRLLVGRRRLRGLFGRHRPIMNKVDQLIPLLARFEQREFIAKRGERQPGLRIRVTVALHTVLREKLCKSGWQRGGRGCRSGNSCGGNSRGGCIRRLIYRLIYRLLRRFGCQGKTANRGNEQSHARCENGTNCAKLPTSHGMSTPA